MKGKAFLFYNWNVQHQNYKSTCALCSNLQTDSCSSGSDIWYGRITISTFHPEVDRSRFLRNVSNLRLQKHNILAASILHSHSSENLKSHEVSTFMQMK
jgi:hypothetical protein